LSPLIGGFFFNLREMVKEKEREEEEKEHEHFLSILSAFEAYESESKKIIDTKLKAISYSSIPNFLKEGPYQRLSKHIGLIEKNQYLMNEIVENQQFYPPSDRIKTDQETTPRDHDKVRSTLRQFVREWSHEGKNERDECFLPIISALQHYFPNPTDTKVLVPGSGLGRLPYEIASLGYSTQGNEFSFFMLLASSYILNSCTDQVEIHPWIHSFSNMPSSKSQLQTIVIPDIKPLQNLDFSMSGGDFIEIYSRPDQLHQWDCLITCFFIDTNKNMVSYIKTIKHLLKPKGKWINLGPLLYHFEGLDKDSIEYTGQEFYENVDYFGFKILEDGEKSAVYASLDESMMKHVYHNLYFVAESL
jgi:carnosine N-methyltransferase